MSVARHGGGFESRLSSFVILLPGDDPERPQNQFNKKIEDTFKVLHLVSPYKSVNGAHGFRLEVGQGREWFPLFASLQVYISQLVNVQELILLRRTS